MYTWELWYKCRKKLGKKFLAILQRVNEVFKNKIIQSCYCISRGLLGQFVEKNWFPLDERKQCPLLQTYCSHHALLTDHGSIIIILVPFGPFFLAATASWRTCVYTIMWLSFRARSVCFLMFKWIWIFFYSILVFSSDSVLWKTNAK